MKIAVILGTRPEAIKLAPVVLCLRASPGVTVAVVNTGQHREMCRQALTAFAIDADEELDTMVPGQSLGRLTAHLYEQIDKHLERLDPEWVLVQGDTATAMVGATTAFYRQINIGHVEAGLRTFEKMSPFPEEINRCFIGHVSTLHFAPTERARDNLLRAEVDKDSILVTGNTVIDAIQLLRPRIVGRQLECRLPVSVEGGTQRLILVTSHRRESFGSGIENVCRAILHIVQQFEDVAVVFPVHPNPNVQGPVRRSLQGCERVHLVEPLSYLDLITLIEKSTLILSDSGGLQEEAPSFGKPILIMRDSTERPEVISAGAGRLVGTSVSAIVNNVRELLTNVAVYNRMARAGNPFGDGNAAERIVRRILTYERRT